MMVNCPKCGLPLTTTAVCPNRLKADLARCEAERDRMRGTMENVEYQIRALANGLGEMLPSIRGKLHVIAGSITKALESESE